MSLLKYLENLGPFLNVDNECCSGVVLFQIECFSCLQGTQGSSSKSRAGSMVLDETWDTEQLLHACYRDIIDPLLKESR